MTVAKKAQSEQKPSKAAGKTRTVRTVRTLKTLPSGTLKKNKGQFTPFEPTDADRQLVMLCAAMGLTQEQTAAQVRYPAGISVETLVKFYRPELEQGADRLAATIAGNIASIARDRSHPKAVTAAIFWLKARRGWRDSPASASATVEIGGGEDGDKDASGTVAPVRFTLKIGERPPEDDA